jgi:hypothetical protein
MLFDDSFGVGEPLNETAFGTGLVIRGKHRDRTREIVLCKFVQILIKGGHYVIMFRQLLVNRFGKLAK